MKNQKQPAVPVHKIEELLIEDGVTYQDICNNIRALVKSYELREPDQYTHEEFFALTPEQRKRSNKMIKGKIIYDTEGNTLNLQYISKIGIYGKAYCFSGLKKIQYRIDPDYKVEAEPKPVEKPEPTYAERQAAWVKENDVKIGDKVKVLRKAEDYEQGWNYDWADKMDALIGEIVEITGEYIDAEDTNGLLVTGDWYMPYFVLEKVPEPQYRPFTLDELPFDSPVRLKTQPKSKRRISFADEKGVYIYILSGDKLTYEQALEELEFADECEDRTFGVRL